MNSLTDTFIWLTALSGAVCMMTWPLFVSRSSILAVQLGIGVSYSIHYALLSAETAAAGNALGAIQILLALLSGGAARLRWISYLPIPLMLLLGAVTWDGPSSLFATVGTVVLALGRAQLDARRLRKVVMVGTAFWLVHDILIWSPVAMVDIVSLAVGGLALLRTSVAAGHSPVGDGACLDRSLTNSAGLAGRPPAPRAALWKACYPPLSAFHALMSTRRYEK